jgi:hypothetical protein
MPATQAMHATGQPYRLSAAPSRPLLPGGTGVQALWLLLHLAPPLSSYCSDGPSHPPLQHCRTKSE